MLCCGMVPSTARCLFTMSAQLRAPESETQQPPQIGLTDIDETDGVKVRCLVRDDRRVQCDLDALQIAAEPVGTLDQDGQQHSYGSLMKQSTEFNDEYFGVVVAEELKMDGGRNDPVISETLRGEEDKSKASSDQESEPLLLERPPSGIFASLIRSLSTPMMGDGDVDDWVGAEDPDWKANHQLSWGQLTDVKEIGKGLTCTVYTAKVPGRKAKVIAKVARPRNNGRLEDQAEKQLEAEFNVLRQVNHPHVVELLGAGFTHEGRRFLLLEHLPEGTLGTFHALSSREEMRGPSTYRRLKQGYRRLTKDLTYTLGRVLQVAEALEYLQTEAIPGATILHRDIRPDNVGIAPGGVVKIFDFGLSKALTKGENGKLVCPMVGEVGSLRFAAPEVSMGLPHGGKADIYSWALLAWSVASVRPPFEGIGRSAFYDRVVVGGERPAMDTSWPKEFQDLLRDCWNGDPLLRPDITQVVTRMKELIKNLGGSS